MIHSLTGLIHTTAAFLAIGLGAIVLLRPKRGRRHRFLGYAFVTTMIVMLVTSFAMYSLTGGFNILHVAAIMSSICLALGLKYAVTRRPQQMWYALHYHWMCWSYVGLLAAFVAETSTRLAMPYLEARFAGFSYGIFWTIVGVASAAVMFAGGLWIERHAPRSGNS
ncbi:MAG: DUF2306 domain-containing protein [Opitutaceae bacterium]|nr:DUF2306 domain-containing protein [Opitutaceae bacterium]